MKKKIDEFLTFSSGLNISRVVEIIEKSPELLDYVVEKSMDYTEKHSWRYAWVIDKLSLTHPTLIEKYLTKYYLLLPKIQKDGHIREILKIISQCNIPEEFEVEIYDRCIHYITVPNYSLSVKYENLSTASVKTFSRSSIRVFRGKFNIARSFS